METIEFKNLELKIKLTHFINIIGPISSGKTTLLKTLINKYPNDNLFIDDKHISSYDLDYKRKNLTVCLNDLTFFTEYVKEELVYFQNYLNIDPDISYENIKKFNKYFNLEELMEAKIEYLTISEKALIKILSLLIINPSVLGLDGIFNYLSVELKLKVIKYAKKHQISILNVTSTAEELLLGTDIIILDNFKLKAYDKTKNILDNDKLLTEIGFELPFVVNLSNGLNYYDILNKKYYNIKSLIGAVWK